MATLYNPYSIGTDDHASGYSQYPSPEAEISKEEEKEQASWLAPFHDYLSRDHSAHKAMLKSDMSDIDRAMVKKAFMDDPEYGWDHPIQVTAASKEVFDSFRLILLLRVLVVCLCPLKLLIISTLI